MNHRLGKERIIVSACLLGAKCRYDGTDRRDDVLAALLEEEYDVVGICPEEMGGFKGKRGPFEIRGKAEGVFRRKSCVVSVSGEDVTDKFIRGAKIVLQIACALGARKAVLKSRSPSCSLNYIYDGTFSGNLIEGMGVTAYLLKESGMEVFDSEDFKGGVEEIFFKGGAEWVL